MQTGPMGWAIAKQKEADGFVSTLNVFYIGYMPLRSVWGQGHNAESHCPCS